MGIFLTFYTNFQHISQQKWEEAYDKTLEALPHCIIPIGRFKKETVLDEEHYVWTRTFWNEEEGNWEIDGDAMTLNYAKRFSLHRNIESVFHFTEGLDNGGEFLMPAAIFGNGESMRLNFQIIGTTSRENKP